jgi:hypothetical protein
MLTSNTKAQTQDLSQHEIKQIEVQRTMIPILAIQAAKLHRSCLSKPTPKLHSTLNSSLLSVMYK